MNDSDGNASLEMSANDSAPVDQPVFGTAIVVVSLLGSVSNGLVAYCMATDSQLRHSSGVICANHALANVAYSAVYLCYVGPLMLLNKGFTNEQPMPSLSVIVWYLFFIGQYFAFSLSMNRVFAVLFPLYYYQHATVGRTVYVCAGIWILSSWHLLFFMLNICPGAYFHAAQSYLALSSSSAKACVDFLRVWHSTLTSVQVNVEMFWLIGLSVFSLFSDLSCTIRVFMNQTIRARMKATDLQFLYQSLCTSLFLCIECFLAGYLVSYVSMSLTMYFVFTTLNRVCGRTISGILVLCFHKNLRTRLCLPICSLLRVQPVVVVQPRKLVAERSTKDSLPSSSPSIQPRLRSAPV